MIVSHNLPVKRKRIFWYIARGKIALGVSLEIENTACKEKMCTRGGRLPQKCAEKLESMGYVAPGHFFNIVTTFALGDRERNSIDIMIVLSLSENIIQRFSRQYFSEEEQKFQISRRT